MSNYNPLAVCNYFIDKANEDASVNDLTLMKLMKLVFFAHGWHLCLNDNKALIDERFEAWKYGPVVSSIYSEFKYNGKDPISVPAIKGNYLETVFMSNDELEQNRISFDSFSVKTCKILDTVWNAYKKFDGITLSNATHKKGTPWDTIWKKKKNERHAEIPNDLILNYFVELKDKKK